MIVGPAIQLLLDGHHLSRADARALMGSIMDGEATAAQIAGFLVALINELLIIYCDGTNSNACRFNELPMEWT